MKTLAGTTFRRCSPGYYVTNTQPEWEIVRTPCHPAYGGGTHWIARTDGGRVVMDPFATLAEAKEAVAREIAQ